MESRVSYMITGAFVLLFSGALLAFILWMGKSGFKEKSYDRYRIYLEESVSGLNIESPVKYKGVEIGTVSAIGIDRKNPDYIEVEIEIEKGIPIYRNYVAFLGSQGITGLKYVEIVKEGNGTAPLVTPGPEGYGIIKAGKSLFGKLEDSAMTISEKIDVALGRINLLLSERNLQTFAKVLDNTEKTTRYIVERRENVDRIIRQIEALLSDDNLRHIRETLRHTDNSAARIDTLLQRHGEPTAQALQATLENADRTLRRIDTLIASGAFDLRAISRESLARLNEVLLEMKRTLRTTEEVLRAFESSPSDILFKSKAIHYGPGEAQ